MQSISRREFVRVSMLGAAATIAAACQPSAPSAVPVDAEPTTAAPAVAPPAVPGVVERFSEAPMLAEQVAQGALPPVEERLPAEPLIVPVVEEIGQYGGTWHRVAVGPGDASLVTNRVGGESMLRWSVDATTIMPNIASSYDVNADATEFTFHLRPGMRWSDGEPFTADAYLFWYDKVLMNKDLSPSVARWLRDGVNDQPVVVEKIDDYTVLFRFESSYGLFVDMAASNTYNLARAGHYLQQFHPDFVAAAELDAMVKAANFTNWWELYGDRAVWSNPELPVIQVWRPTRVPPAVPIVAERNPYYWKVDPEGNQLPYIDEVQFDVVENADLLNMKAVAGEIDCQFRHINWVNYPLFMENANKAGYRVFRWTLAEGSNCALMLNHNHPDPVMRELIETKDFRVALSMGIDRNAIAELAYQGLGEPRQAALISTNAYFRPEHATRYADHEVDAANALLDGLGLTARDAEGFRLRPDGQPLSIFVEYALIFGPWRDVVEMFCDQWKDIGIRGVPKEEDRTLFVQRGAANERDAGVWTLDRCATPLVHPYWFMPTPGGYAWSELYGKWYETGGRDGEEPPEDVKRQCELYDRIKSAKLDEIPALAQEFFDNFSEQCWVIGTVGMLPHVGVVKENFRNVPESAVSDVLQQSPSNTNVEQYFIRA